MSQALISDPAVSLFFAAESPLRQGKNIFRARRSDAPK